MNSELCNDSYDVFRCDRDPVTSGKSRGGGVLVLVRKFLRPRLRDDLCCSPAEAFWITVEVPGAGRVLHVCSAYIAGGINQVRDISIVLNSLKKLKSNNKDCTDYTILIGDFNMPNVRWSPNGPEYIHRGTTELQNMSISMIEELTIEGFSQFNMYANNCGNILDLVFCNFSLEVCRSDCPIIQEECFHPALQIELNDIALAPLRESAGTRVLRYKFRKANYHIIREAICSIEWMTLLNGLTIDDDIDIFYDSLYSIIEQHVPKITYSGRYSYPIWYSPALIKVIGEKSRAHKRWKRFNNPSDYETFSLLRSRQKYMQVKCHNDYTNIMQREIKNNPKKLWSYIKSRRSNSHFPCQLEYRNNTFNNGQTICEGFNEYFASVFSTPASHYDSIELAPPFCDSGDQINDITITEAQIFKIIQNLDNSGGPGSDKIPPYFISCCARELCVPLAIIFNRSIKEGIFPYKWKVAHIIPIHKKGSKSKIDNYRPISILNIFSKILEKVVYNNIYQLIINGIPSAQHGFVKSRSTTTNLVEFINFVSSAMENRCQVDVIYTDFEKAFDRVDHVILLRKLLCLGIRGNLYRWVCSYLANRTQAVRLGNYISGLVQITSGVPQGSHLGPLFYNAYLYDIYKVIHNSNYLMYADDTKIFIKANDISDCIKLQSDLDRLFEYYNFNRININPSKCVQMTFTRNKKLLQYSYKIGGVILKRVEVVRDLGVILDPKLIFDKHIENITNNAFKNLGFVIRVCKHFTEISCIKLVYFAYVRSGLEYASSIWSPCYSIYKEKIERIQSIFLKHLNYRLKRESSEYLDSCRTHNLLPLTIRRELLDMLLLYDIVNGKIDCSELVGLVSLRTPTRRTRVTCRTLFNIPNCSTNYTQNSTLPRLFRLYNEKYINVDVYGNVKKSFKNGILKQIGTAFREGLR